MNDQLYQMVMQQYQQKRQAMQQNPALRAQQAMQPQGQPPQQEEQSPQQDRGDSSEDMARQILTERMEKPQRSGWDRALDMMGDFGRGGLSAKPGENSLGMAAAAANQGTDERNAAEERENNDILPYLQHLSKMTSLRQKQEAEAREELRKEKKLSLAEEAEKRHANESAENILYKRDRAEQEKQKSSRQEKHYNQMEKRLDIEEKKEERIAREQASNQKYRIGTQKIAATNSLQKINESVKKELKEFTDLEMMSFPREEWSARKKEKEMEIRSKHAPQLRFLLDILDGVKAGIASPASISEIESSGNLKESSD